MWCGLNYSLLMYIISLDITYSMEVNDLLRHILHLVCHNNLQPYLVSQNTFPITASTWSFAHTALYLNNSCSAFTFFVLLPALRPSSEVVVAEGRAERRDTAGVLRICRVWLFTDLCFRWRFSVTSKSYTPASCPGLVLCFLPFALLLNISPQLSHSLPWH